MIFLDLFCVNQNCSNCGTKCHNLNDFVWALTLINDLYFSAQEANVEGLLKKKKKTLLGEKIQI